MERGCEAVNLLGQLLILAAAIYLQYILWLVEKSLYNELLERERERVNLINKRDAAVGAGNRFKNGAVGREEIFDGSTVHFAAR